MRRSLAAAAGLSILGWSAVACDGGGTIDDTAAQPRGDVTSSTQVARPTMDPKVRRVLDASIGAGAADRVVAASETAGVCDALGAAVDATVALAGAEGAELEAMVLTAKEPIDAAALVIGVAGLERTSAHWVRYGEALAATASDFDPADPSSRERANHRFRVVQALGAGSTETELEALAELCGVEP